MDKMDIIAFLNELPAFSEVKASGLEWFVEHSEILKFKEGDYWMKPGDPVDYLIVFLAGEMEIYVDTPEGRLDIFLYHAGDITGHLPFSRSKGANAFGRFTENSELLALHRNKFTEMVAQSYTLTQALVAVMSDRIRDISQNQFQDEKLKALGKLSAGLAHELNNPASAIVRSAETLHAKLSETPEKFKAVMRLNVTEEETDAINDIMFSRMNQCRAEGIELGLMEREERFDELNDWLLDHDIEEEAFLDILVDFDFRVEDLEQMKAVLQSPERMEAVLGWFDDRLTVEQLVNDIRDASGRVSDLIASIKNYSHMDQGKGKVTISLNEGLTSTLRILNHKVKQKNIQVFREMASDLPKIQAHPGELNQVWTNLLDNAIDALPESGTLTLRTYYESQQVCVDIEDNGKGIPEEILNRIWEPFFTTKSQGEGTGIGLDIVKKIIRRHRGNIYVSSEPGKTLFTVKFLIG